MTGFEYQMFVKIYELCFFLGKGTPEHKNDMFFFLRYRFDDIVGYPVPAKICM